VGKGGGVLAFVSPVFDAGGEVAPSGLEPLASLLGAKLGRDLVLETDPSARLPRGAGEVFFAVPRQHEVTRGLLSGDKIDFRVLLSEAQSLRLEAQARGRALLGSSAQAIALGNVRDLLDGKGPPDSSEHAERVLGVAGELEHRARIVLVGAGNPPENKSFRDPALVGDRLFVENAVSWVTARPALVSVPQKTAHDVALALTEDSLSEVLRYVLIYLPGVSALLGVLVMLERRKREKRGRARAAKGAAE
jgi:hypothetical protein